MVLKAELVPHAARESRDVLTKCAFCEGVFAKDVLTKRAFFECVFAKGVFACTRAGASAAPVQVHAVRQELWDGPWEAWEGFRLVEGVRGSPHSINANQLLLRVIFAG